MTFSIIIRENSINNFDPFSDRSQESAMKEMIAANLIRYRKSLGLSQEQLAEQAGVTRQSINNYENAKTLPDSKILSALASVLGITLDDLLRSQGEGLPNFRFRAHVTL